MGSSILNESSFQESDYVFSFPWIQSRVVDTAFLTTAGEKMCIFTEIIRISAKGATRDEVSAELSLSPEQTTRFMRFLEGRDLLTRIKGANIYAPSQKGLLYLEMYDQAADLVDTQPQAYYLGRSGNKSNPVYWEKSEVSARMREIIDR